MGVFLVGLWGVSVCGCVWMLGGGGLYKKKGWGVFREVGDEETFDLG